MARCVNSATTEATIEKLRTTFATHGLPEVIVPDNGSVFTSEDFKISTRRNGIRHVTSAPYHRTDLQTRDEEARERKYRNKTVSFPAESHAEDAD